MDDPTEKKLIISGKATVTETDNPTTSMRRVIVPDENLTLDGLMESWKFPYELKERCLAMCANYVQGPENFSRCLDLMDYLAQRDSSKENFPSIAPHLPVIFSLPTQNQEELLTAIGENINQGNFSSAYKCILETHEEALRARVYSGLERLGLTQSDLDHRYIWENLNAVFAQHSFSQDLSNEDQDESLEIMRRLDFLEEIVPHYLRMAELVASHLDGEKPIEAKAITRRVVVKYATFYDAKTWEEVFEKVKQYTLIELEKVGKKVPPAGDSAEQEACKTIEHDLDELAKLLKDELGQLRMMTHPGSKEGEVTLPEIKGKVSEYIALNRQLTETNARLEGQITASAEETATLRKQYAEYVSPAAHHAALENESRALKAQYDQYISLKEYHAKATEWNATKKKLEEAVKEAKKASAPSGSGRWKLAAALALAAGGILYLSEAGKDDLEGQVQSLTVEKHDYSLPVKQLVNTPNAQTAYQNLTGDRDTQIAEEEPIEDNTSQSESTVVEPDLVLGYLTPEEAGGHILLLEEHSDSIEDIKGSLAQAVHTSELRYQMSDESNQKLQEEKEALSAKVDFYETKDLCMQFRRLVEEKDKKGINTFSMRFAENYFGGCRSMNLSDFADRICYLYRTDKSYPSVKKDVIQKLTDIFKFDPDLQIRICP